jgi:1-phosphofructokinase family hexose kinase
MSRSIQVACPNYSLDRTMRVPRVQRGQIHRSADVDVRGGGKGVNVARALRSLGVVAPVLGFAGGNTGIAITGLLRAEGFDATSVEVDGEARSCLTVIDDEITVFNESGMSISTADWDRFEDAAARWIEPGGIFVCSGSWPPETPSDAAARLVKLARDRGCLTILDTSRAQLAEALAAGPDFIKPNVAEAEAVLSGTAGEPAEEGAGALDRARWAAEELLRTGPKHVIVSAGGEGAVMADADGIAIVRAPAVDVVNPVGAGDCFIAGLAFGSSLGEAARTALERAVAAGSAGCEMFAAGQLDARRAAELLEQLRDLDGV